MLKFFRSRKKPKGPPAIQDLNGTPLYEGDIVESLRYDLGECRLELEGLEFFYVSQSSGKKVSYVRMVDAITGHQKVRKKD